MTFRAVIVDDEELARDRVRSLLETQPDFEVVDECSNGAEAVAAISELTPDVVFLDIQMPGLDGFEVVERVGTRRMPHTVFVTAFDQHAVRAFNSCALDYLLKPFDSERVRETLERIRSRQSAPGELVSRLEQLLQELSPAGRSYPPTLVVRSGPRLVLVEVKDAIAFTADGNYIRIHTGSKSYLLRETMTNLERRLDPSEFVRIHRSAIVRIGSIATLESVTYGEYQVVLRNGTKLSSSRTYRERLEHACGID
jgi:two-component system LytT family response regulator